MTARPSGLARAIERSARAAGLPFEIDSHQSSAWHSITFSGERHRIAGRAMAGRAFDEWAASLDGRAIHLSGALVADLTVSDCERADGIARFRIEGVTVAMA